MVLLDAYALLAFFKNEKAADEVAALLRRESAVSAVNLAEVSDHLIRIQHCEPEFAKLQIARLLQTNMLVIPLDEQLASRVGEIRAHFYEARACALSMADCCAMATALVHEIPLATSDPAILSVMRTLGGQLVELPGSG